jgi:ubiquinone/menaquinone biosynthesis C-methylase UbiE
MGTDPPFTLPMPLSTITRSADTTPLSEANASAAHKARFWDRIARKYAANPIADVAGCEATLRRVQGLLSTDQDVLEIGCGTGSTALRLAPHTRRLLAIDVSAGMIDIAREKLAFAVADADLLQSAIARQSMDIVSVECHGTRGKDIRVFIAAREPG